MASSPATADNEVFGVDFDLYPTLEGGFVLSPSSLIDNSITSSVLRLTQSALTADYSIDAVNGERILLDHGVYQPGANDLVHVIRTPSVIGVLPSATLSYQGGVASSASLGTRFQLSASGTVFSNSVYGSAFLDSHISMAASGETFSSNVYGTAALSSRVGMGAAGTLFSSSVYGTAALSFRASMTASAGAVAEIVYGSAALSSYWVIGASGSIENDTSGNADLYFSIYMTAAGEVSGGVSAPWGKQTPVRRGWIKEREQGSE